MRQRGCDVYEHGLERHVWLGGFGEVGQWLGVLGSADREEDGIERGVLEEVPVQGVQVRACYTIAGEFQPRSA